MTRPDQMTHIDFSHAFQPIIDIDCQKIVAYEVLLRGRNQEPPGHVFRQVKKKYMMAFDQLSREKAIASAATMGLNCSLSLNFPPHQILFDGGYYVKRTIECAKQHSIHPHQLIIEITESEVVHDTDTMACVLDMLRSAGISVSIDDFGAGHAGLSLLADIQPDLVKIDMHLIRGIGRHGPRQSIVTAINNICLDLGIDVLAEGVETNEEFRFLERIGIPLYQGNYFARPAFEKLIPAHHLNYPLSSGTRTDPGLMPQTFSSGTRTIPLL